MKLLKGALIFVVLLPFLENCTNMVNSCDGVNTKGFQKFSQSKPLVLTPGLSISHLTLYKSMSTEVEYEMLEDSSLSSDVYLIELEIEGESWAEEKIAYVRNQFFGDSLHLWVTTPDEDYDPSFVRLHACTLAPSYANIVTARIHYPPGQEFAVNQRMFWE